MHYQIPAAVDVYVHRCGRTARASAEGISVAMVAAKEMPRFSALLKVRKKAAMDYCSVAEGQEWRGWEKHMRPIAFK